MTSAMSPLETPGLGPNNGTAGVSTGAPAPVGGSGSTCLADFKQLARLGEGAFSVVYKVQRLADKGIYALKMVKLPSLKDKEKQNALNEVRLLASVTSDHIIAYKEAFFDEKFRCLCIVTEFADKGDLFQQISKCQKERTRMPENQVWRYLFGMCHGLKALHDKKILHRDLKCANVFLSNAPQGLNAKLGDFNVSKVAKRGLCVTQTGTPYYASPEVWRDMPYDAKSDMWSIGCVLYEMLALRPPFQAEDMEGLYRKVLNGRYPAIPRNYSADLDRVVATLLQVNPRKRPTVDELLNMPEMRNHCPASIDDKNSSCDLLQTIKLPSNAIDLSGCLPKPRYELPSKVEEELSEYSPEYGSDAGGGGRRGHQQRANRPLPPDVGVRSGRDPLADPYGYGGTTHQQQAPVPAAPAPAAAQAQVGDSLDAYMQQQPRMEPRLAQQQRQGDGEESQVSTQQGRGTRQVRQYRQNGYRNGSGQRGQAYGNALPPPENDRGLHSASEVSLPSPSRGPPSTHGSRPDLAQREPRRQLGQSRSQAAPQKPPPSSGSPPQSRNRGLRLPRIFG